MKRLTVALLLFSVFGPTVFAQSGEPSEDPWAVFSGWIEMVKGAERDYKNKNGRYGDLAALHKAHLLDRLAVSYTHLDVYKRQAWVSAWSVALSLRCSG